MGTHLIYKFALIMVLNVGMANHILFTNEVKRLVCMVYMEASYDARAPEVYI